MLQKYLGLPRHPIVFAQQKHTNHAGVVDETVLAHMSREGRFIFHETDAIICPIPGITISVFTADCVPVFLADQESRAIALVHAGWRGTFARIAQRTVDRMREIGCAPRNIIAWLGPAISGSCYEVSAELADQFTRQFADAKSQGIAFVRGRRLDLPALNVFQLVSAGIPSSNITDCGICAFCEASRFYSYRADGEGTGRIVSSMTVDIGGS